MEGSQLYYGVFLFAILLAPFIIRYHCCWLCWLPRLLLASLPLRIAVAPAYLAPVAVRVGVGGGGFILKEVAEALGNVGVVVSVANHCSAMLCLAGVRVVAVLAAPSHVGGVVVVAVAVLDIRVRWKVCRTCKALLVVRWSPCAGLPVDARLVQCGWRPPALER